MEWVKKANFDEILATTMNSDADYFFQAESPFVLLNDLPPIHIQPKIPTYYQRPRLSIEERITKYVNKWDIKKQNAWQKILDLAQHYNIEGIYPWLIKDTFKKMAKTLHPDHNSKPSANHDFQALYRAYKTLI